MTFLRHYKGREKSPPKLDFNVKRISANKFALIHLILEAKLGDYPLVINGTKYSIVEQVKFIEDNL